jgi:hypothetical protein
MNKGLTRVDKEDTSEFLHNDKKHQKNMEYLFHSFHIAIMPDWLFAAEPYVSNLDNTDWLVHRNAFSSDICFCSYPLLMVVHKEGWMRPARKRRTFFIKCLNYSNNSRSQKAIIEWEKVSEGE